MQEKFEETKQVTRVTRSRTSLIIQQMLPEVVHR
jgi:hypothetical protein